MKQRMLVFAQCVMVFGLLNMQVHAKSNRGDQHSSYRSAKSGQYVQKDYAQRHQATTVRERKR
jgi:hypothetical protein